MFFSNMIKKELEEPNVEDINWYYFNKYHSVSLAKKATEKKVLEYLKQKEKKKEKKKMRIKKKKKKKNKKRKKKLINYLTFLSCCFQDFYLQKNNYKKQILSSFVNMDLNQAKVI